jgi:hypothetical protein
MAKTPNIADLDKAITLRLKGEPWKNVLPLTGLSHSQAENHEMRFKMLLQAEGLATAEDLGGDWSPMAFSPEAVRDARKDGLSWGAIMIRMGRTEGQVRKAFKEATGIHSTATRVGRGGRFIGDAEGAHLYAHNPAAGTAVPQTQPRIPELTQKGDIKGLKPEERQVLSSLDEAFKARRANALTEAKAARKERVAK